MRKIERDFVIFSSLLDALENPNQPYVTSLIEFGEKVMMRTVNPIEWDDFFYHNFLPRGRRVKQLQDLLLAFTRDVGIVFFQRSRS